MTWTDEDFELDGKEQVEKIKARLSAEKVYKKIPNKMKTVERLIDIAKKVSEKYQIDIDVDATGHSFVITFYLEYIPIMGDLKTGFAALFFSSDDIL